MTIIDGVQELANKLSAEIKGNLARYQNQSFRDACMAICALVAMADGVLQEDERRKVIACIQNTDALGHFSATDLRDIFVRFCDLAKDDFTRVEVIKAIRKVKGDADQSDRVVKIGIIIAKSDRDFAAVEKAVICEVIRELGLSQLDYGLDSVSASSASVSPAPVATVPSPVLPPHVTGSPLKDVKKGERISLKQVAGSLPADVLVGVGFETTQAASFAVSARVYDKEKRLLAEVTETNRSWADCSILHRGNVRLTSAMADDAEVGLTFAARSQAVSILFVVSGIASVPTMKDLSGVYLRVSESTASGRQLVCFAHTLQGKPQVVVLSRLYLHNDEWKFQAIGEEIPSQNADALNKVIATFA